MYHPDVRVTEGADRHRALLLAAARSRRDHARGPRRRHAAWTGRTLRLPVLARLRAALLRGQLQPLTAARISAEPSLAAWIGSRVAR
jgi:hypothetical protein